MTPERIILQILIDVVHLSEEDRLKTADEAIALKIKAGYQGLQVEYPAIIYRLCCEKAIIVPDELMAEAQMSFGGGRGQNAGEHIPWARKAVRSFSMPTPK